ncbi:LCP family protein [Aquibacillus sp. 3ASR75-11]|uniref:LCP family protein n=1 Tax=Terrihalobacillus insolitus TaxID=2950438 RepID=A0A9X3WVA6_9BACI|nr:LCP family protein [Terrihalobacillus insolitus]MDC3415244.1 LCP family protein [Terrihalobacillus insolitus]MDC3426315.1 LCP family protein [Terrihalobacillus insolitus]
MKDSRMNRRNSKKPKTWVKRVLFLAILLFLVVISYGGYLAYQAYDAASDSYTDLERPDEKSERRETAVTIGEEPISILLLGIENYTTDGKDGRADTQIVVTLNPKENEMTMTTVPRDTRVELSNVEQYSGFHKINAAYTYGSITGYGANKLAIETVEDLLDIPIDKFIAVDFEGFRDIVDALDGVTVDIKEPFWEKNIYNNNQRIYFEKGPKRLNGEESLAFVRMRKRDVNVVYSREERQRQFIRAAIDEAISAGTLFKVGEISDILGKNVDTNLKPREIYTLQKAYSSIDASEIETINIEGTNQMIDGLSYFIPNEGALDTASIQIKQALGLMEETNTNTDQSDEEHTTE